MYSLKLCKQCENYIFILSRESFIIFINIINYVVNILSLSTLRNRYYFIFN